MFALRDVGYDHPGRTLFNSLDLDLGTGRFTGIIGPNGCGKTTLLDLICRHRRPCRGTIDHAGRPLSRYGRRSLARRIALVPQDYGISFPFTVEEAEAVAPPAPEETGGGGLGAMIWVFFVGGAAGVVVRAQEHGIAFANRMLPQMLSQ